MCTFLLNCLSDQDGLDVKSRIAVTLGCIRVDTHSHKLFCGTPRRFYKKNSINSTLANLKTTLKLKYECDAMWRINNSLYLPWKQARIFFRGHYLCWGFEERSSSKCFSFEEEIMSKAKYKSIFSRKKKIILFERWRLNFRSFDEWRHWDTLNRI